MKGPGGFEVVEPPPGGLWRVARGPDPLALPPASPPQIMFNPRSGNRFDSPMRDYSVTYAGTELECCYVETLARFRVDAELPVAEIASDWAELHHMNLGSIAKDWHVRRLKAHITLPTDALLVDADHVNSVKAIRSHYRDLLDEVGIADLDRGDVLGKNRLITRWISQAVNDFKDDEGIPAFQGIRYTSRIDRDLEAWAIFDRCDVTLKSSSPVSINDPALIAAAKKLGIRPH